MMGYNKLERKLIQYSVDKALAVYRNIDGVILQDQSQEDYGVIPVFSDVDSDQKYQDIFCEVNTTSRGKGDFEKMSLVMAKKMQHLLTLLAPISQKSQTQTIRRQFADELFECV